MYNIYIYIYIYIYVILMFEMIKKIEIKLNEIICNGISHKRNKSAVKFVTSF
jgi:hypothetical protein